MLQLIDLIMNTNTKVMMVDAHSCYFAKKPCGEDAHFICREKQVIGVADGLGYWRNRGIDAGDFARELMKNAHDFVVNNSALVDPKSVLFDAFNKMADKIGSSTACIVALDGNRLRAANLGDSGFMVIRGGKTVYRSPVQQHKFNCPYSVGRFESWVQGPVLAAEMEVEVESGVVVVAATDGLFDNVFPDEIEATVERCLKGGMRAKMARNLAKAARRNYRKQDTDGPFAKAAQEAGIHHTGGKRDDITVVVACVESVEDLLAAALGLA